MKGQKAAGLPPAPSGRGKRTNPGREESGGPRPFKGADHACSAGLPVPPAVGVVLILAKGMGPDRLGVGGIQVFASLGVPADHPEHEAACQQDPDDGGAGDGCYGRPQVTSAGWETFQATGPVGTFLINQPIPHEPSGLHP